MEGLSRWKISSLVLMRLLIGWHFLHEGLVKLLDVHWSSASFLKDSKWILSEVFHSMAENEYILRIVDIANVWGLIAIGIGLIAGLLTRYAVIAAMILLTLYFIAAVPLPGMEYSIPAEGNYLFVNKTLVELSALFVLLMFPTSKIIGLDRIIKRGKNRYDEEENRNE